MAPKSVVDIAIEHIDAQIADLNRAKQILVMAANQPATEAPPQKKRGRKRKTGLPADNLSGSHTITDVQIVSVGNTGSNGE